MGDDRREAERRLVEQHELRTRHHRPGDREHLLLAAGHAPGLLVAALAEAREHLVPALDVGSTSGRASGSAEPQVLVDGQIDERATTLRNVADAGPPRSGRVCAPDDAPVERMLPERVDHARDGAQRRGLPGAVGAEDHDDLALGDREVDAVQHLHRPVAGAQPATSSRSRRVSVTPVPR